MRKTACALLAIALLWTMQLAAAPTAADLAGTGAMEKTGVPPAAVKKSPLLPILIGVGAAAAAVVLVLVVFKAKYDVIGEWELIMVQDQDHNSWAASLTFNGGKKSGTVAYSEAGMPSSPGTYTVDGKEVSFAYDWIMFTPPFRITHTGRFSDANTMAGEWVSSGGGTGTWSAKKK